MATSVMTYSSRNTSVFVPWKMNVIGNVEVCYLKSVKLKFKVLQGASVDCVERKLNNVFLIRSVGMRNTGFPSMVVPLL
jgi:hypothetical protein